MKCVERWLTRPGACSQIRPLVRRQTPHACIAIIILLDTLAGPVSAQLTQSERPNSVHGIVINSATHEPISRALVSSPDNRFATLTDSEGRFEFTIPRNPSGPQADEGSEAQAPSDTVMVTKLRGIGSGTNMLMARKPGFLQDPSGSAINLQENGADKDWIIPLIPESRIVGKVALANFEAPDSIQIELYRRIVQEGRARWVFMKGTASRSDGEFRFADLPAGTYKLLSRELLDRDPLNFDPRGRLFGYPPVYYPSAAGFGSAAEIHVAAGETAQTSLTIVRQAYYNVSIPVLNAPGAGLGISVFVAGNRGPGFSLGFNERDQSIEGMLPNGTYTVEATSYGVNNNVAAGSINLTVHDGPASGPPMTLLMGASIPVTVHEEFTATQKWDSGSSWSTGTRRFTLSGPRRYLNVMLDPEDDFGAGRGAGLRTPTSSNDQSLVLENVLPGRYWLRISSARGYVASVRSGNANLLQEPLTVGEGGSPAPIEITMRDETAEIEGTVEGIPSPPPAVGATDGAERALPFTAAAAHVYCIPLPDSGGNFTEVWVSPDGNFHSAPLVPGAYRVLAFARPQSELEYHNPEAMQAYDSKGPVVRVSAGQKENVRLQLISPE